MDVSEIINLARENAEEYYSDPVWIDFINLAIDDLTPIAKLLTSNEFTPETVADGKVSLDFGTNPELAANHEILNVFYKTTGTDNYKQLRSIPISDNVTRGWKKLQQEILIQNLPIDTAETTDTADIRVDLYKKVPHITELTDIPEIPEQYHNLIVLYICAKSQQKEEELNDKNDFYAEYLMNKRNMGMDRIWEVEPHNRKFIRRMRVLGQVGGGMEQQR